MAARRVARKAALRFAAFPARRSTRRGGVVRCRSGTVRIPSLRRSGSAVHHFVLHRIRETVRLASRRPRRDSESRRHAAARVLPRNLSPLDVGCGGSPAPFSVSSAMSLPNCPVPSASVRRRGWPSSPSWSDDQSRDDRVERVSITGAGLPWARRGRPAGGVVGRRRVGDQRRVGQRRQRFAEVRRPAAAFGRAGSRSTR